MKEVTNFEEAKIYIAQHYVFTDTVYPILAKLEPEEKNVFIIKHCLLRMYENMYTFLTETEKVFFELIPEYNYILVEASAKIMINILKLSEIMNLDLELHSRAWHFKEEYKDILKHTTKISAECEKFDRTNNYSYENIQVAIEQLWYRYIKIINFQDLLFYDEMYKVISIVV